MGALLQDFAPPSGVPGGVTFTDSDPGLGLVSGDVVVARAANEEGVAGASERQKGS